MNNFSNQSTVSLIDLAKIAANPYQPREVEDPLRVAKVAESILTDGLLQPAVGRRRPDGVVQLAFGHTRWAAFRLLDQIAQDPGEVKRDLSETPGLEQLLERSVAGELLPIEKLTWCSLPLMERDLIDEEMFRLAIAENVRRHDLTPIEEAKAMRRYRAEFNKNSADIGSLFGKSDSTVRNIMRLLELPEPIQDQVAKGEISEGSARMLLGAQRAAPQAVLAAAEQMSAQGLDTPAAVGEAIRKEVKKTAFEMCAPWREKAIAGAGLWHFGWTPEELPVLDRIRVNKIFEGLKLEPFSDKTTFERAWWGAATGNVRDMNVQMAVFPEDQRVRAAEALMVLARPPSCNTCPFYTRLEGYHYCGIKACWERKRTAWMDQAAHDLSVKLSIQLYDKARDGSPYEDMQQWDAEAKKFWADKADHLRLVSHYSEYGEYSFTKSSLVKVVSVRKEFQEKAAAEKAQEKEQAKTNESNAKRQEEIQLRYKMIGRYLAAIAVPIMARSLAGLSDGAVEILCQVFYQNWNYGLAEAKKAWNGDYRAVFWGKVMESILPSEVRRDSPLACARHLQGVATAWGKGLELPAEWLELAERFEAEEAEEKMKYAEDANYWDTPVHPAKSLGEIQEMLDDFGATATMVTQGQSNQGVFAWLIRFQWQGRAYRFTFTPLVCKWPGKVMTYNGKKRTNEEQARYQMGRIAVWFVKAILTAAEAQGTALFGYMELPGMRQGGMPPVASEVDVEELTGRLPGFELPKLTGGGA